MQDKNPSTILRLPLRVWADSPHTQDTFKQQQGRNSTSNQHNSDTRATRMHTLALCPAWNHKYFVPCMSVLQFLEYSADSWTTSAHSKICSRGDELHSVGHTLSHHHNKLRCDLHLPTADQSSLHLPSDLQTIWTSATYQADLSVGLLHIQILPLIRSGPMGGLSVTLTLTKNFLPSYG